MSDLKYMQPVIIIGAGRSGTKFFRDTLLFSKETCAIPYDINYIWRHGNEHCEHDELTANMADNASKKYIRSSIVKMASKKNFEARFLLEKTVSNGLRVDFVKAIFPEAKFIHLVRDGRAVSESAMRMWNAPPKTEYLLKKMKYFPWRNYKYASQYLMNYVQGMISQTPGLKIWGPRYNGIQEDVRNKTLLDVCATQWERCVIEANQSLECLPKDRSLTVKYEDLIKSTDVLNQVISFIGIEKPEVIVDEFNKKLKLENAEKWREALSESEIKFLNDRLSNSLAALGYLT